MQQKIIPPLVVIAFFFAVLFCYTKFAGPIPFRVDGTQTTKTTSFSVTGQGTVSVPPDEATVMAGATATAPTLTQAQDQLNAQINAVTAAVEKTGVAKANIQTANYSISPQYDFKTGTQKITGYTANSTMTIKVKQIDNVNAVIDAATANGANIVGNVLFEVADKTAAQNQARQKAVADAKQKAENAAKIAGFHLGNLVDYQEDFGDTTPRPIVMNAAVGAAPAQATPPTQVNPGSSDITVTVTLSYNID